MRGAAWVALVAVLAACRGGQPEPARAPAAPGTLAEARAAVFAELGEPRCTGAAECRVAGLGAKPCGGPEAYVPYSVATTDTLRLAAALARYRETAARRNAEQELVSDCQFVSPPPVRCDAGRCVTR